MICTASQNQPEIMYSILDDLLTLISTNIQCGFWWIFNLTLESKRIRSDINLLIILRRVLLFSPNGFDWLALRFHQKYAQTWNKSNARQSQPMFVAIQWGVHGQNPLNHPTINFLGLLIQRFTPLSTPSLSTDSYKYIPNALERRQWHFCLSSR